MCLACFKPQYEIIEDFHPQLAPKLVILPSQSRKYGLF